MKAKRILSALLTVIMLLSVVASLSLTGVAAEAEVIHASYTNPAIPATVGKAINLANVKVAFDATNAPAADVTWKDASGKTITSFTPSAGVSKLTATSGTKSRTIYVVTANANGEYVLYENDFNSTTVDALKKEGWSVMGSSQMTVSNGALHIGSKSDSYARVILPEWLGDFGDYSITANVSLTDVLNDTRWCSIAYRIENENKKYYPYYHMCVREGANVASGLEFAERNASDGWTIIYNTVKKEALSSYHKLTVSAYRNIVDYRIDDTTYLYIDSATGHNKGYLGLIANYGVMNVDSIRVTLQLSAPTTTPSGEVAKLIDTSSNRTENGVSNYLSNHAFATLSNYTSILNGASKPVAVMLDLTSATATQTQVQNFMLACQKANAIPEFYVKTTAQVDTIEKALTTAKIPETLIASADPAVTKYARTKNRITIRGAVVVTDTKSVDTLKLYTDTTGANAMIVILPYELATKELVAQLQAFQLCVWAMATGVDTVTEASYLIASGANAVITDNFSLINSTQALYFGAANALTRTPVATGHRGYHNTASLPENSMAAFRAAYENGADCIEIDVYLTKDKRVVICHDSDISATSNGTGNITGYTLAELQKFRLRNRGSSFTNETFPTMDELLDYIADKNVKIVCELKGSQSDLAETVLKLVEKKNAQDKVVFISFAADHLTRLKSAVKSGASTGLLATLSQYVSASDTAATLNIYKAAQDSSLRCHSNLALAFSNMTSEFMRDAADRGMPIFSWTYSEGGRSVAANYFLSGMNGMTSDDTPFFTNVVKTISAPQTAYAKAGTDVSFGIIATTYGRKSTAVTDVNYTILEDNGVLALRDGKLVAVKNGTASVLVSYTAKVNNTPYVLYTQPVAVTVGDAPTTLMLNGNQPNYKIADGLLEGLKENTTVKTVLDAIYNAEGATVYDASGKNVTNNASAKLGTGSKILYNGKETVIVVLGDLDGNGKLESRDYFIAKQFILNVGTPTAAQKKAMDVLKDGKQNARDYFMMKSHLLGQTNIYA